MCIAQFDDFQRIGEAAVHDREFGGEGVNITMLFCARAGRELAVIFLMVIGPRKNNISTNEANKDGPLK